MSIIVTQISKHGIVFGSDSNITNDTEVVKEDKKIFEIPKLKAAICVAGSYQVNNEIMSEWMPKFIEFRADGYQSLKDFAELLKDRLEEEMTDDDKRELFIAHLGGYENSHPEMWHIRNTKMDEDGKYFEDVFAVSENFWSQERNDESLESKGLIHTYINGFTPGRIAFNIVSNYLREFFKNMWQQRNFKFRPPVDIKEQEELIKTYIKIIISLFVISDYRPKFIGGEPKTFSIPRP